MFVGRLKVNGRLDASFAQRGLLAELPTAEGSMANAVAMQGRKILVNVLLKQDKRRSELLLRLNQNGHPDRTFAGDGIARVSVPTPQKLGVQECGYRDETASVLPLGNRILLVHNGTGPPVLAFSRNGRRDRSMSPKSIAPDRNIAPDCFAGPFGSSQDGSAVLAWSKPLGDPTWGVALQRLESR